jgi:hypothetical protein
MLPNKFMVNSSSTNKSLPTLKRDIIVINQITKATFKTLTTKVSLNNIKLKISNTTMGKMHHSSSSSTTLKEISNTTKTNPIQIILTQYSNSGNHQQPNGNNNQHQHRSFLRNN